MPSDALADIAKGDVCVVREKPERSPSHEGYDQHHRGDGNEKDATYPRVDVSGLAHYWIHHDSHAALTLVGRINRLSFKWKSTYLWRIDMHP
jgi:hypothetical protein